MDSLRFRLRLALVTALLVTTTAPAAMAVSVSDPIRDRLATLQGPCNQAIDDERRAAGLIRYVRDANGAVNQGATRANARRAKTLIALGRGVNGRCPARDKLSPHEQRLFDQGALVDKTYREDLFQTRRLVFELFTTLDKQADTLLQAPGPYGAPGTFTEIDRVLTGCMTNPRTLASVRNVCKWQLDDNHQTERSYATIDPRGACVNATRLADEAGKTLQVDVEMAYDKAHDGLVYNKGCAQRDVHDINEGYLLSWRTAADMLLNIAPQSDPDIVRDPGNASPFAVSTRELQACRDRTGYARNLSAEVADHCRKQLAFDAPFEKQYRDTEQPPPPPAGAQPLTPAPLDPANFRVRAESQFDWTQNAPGPGETEKFSAEKVRVGPHWADAGSQDVRSGRRPWVLFSLIRSFPEFTAEFEPLSSPALVTADFFKTRMLVVAVQRSPRQRCTLDPVGAYSIPGENPRVVPALLISYRYRCAASAPAVAGQPAYPGEPAVTSVFSLPRTSGAFVTFLENGASLTTLR